MPANAGSTRGRSTGGGASAPPLHTAPSEAGWHRSFAADVLVGIAAGALVFVLAWALSHPTHIAGAQPEPDRERLLEWLLAATVAVAMGLAFFAVQRHRAMLRARAAERSFRDLYDHISEGVFRSTLDGRMISANPALVRLNGYEREEDLIRCCNDIATEWYVEPGRRSEIHHMLLEHGRVSGVISEIYRHKTRERIWIEESVRLVRDERTGKPLYYDGTLREVTETMRRLELQDRYNKIASIVSACLYQHRMTPDGRASMPYASIGLLHIFGIHPEAVAENTSILVSRIHPDDLERIKASLKHSSETLTVWQCEYRVCLPDGTEKWVYAHSMPEREADGSTLWHGYIMDVSERKRSEARIYELAFFDPLTRLPNRAMLEERIRSATAAEARPGRHGALLFIDLDHFKVLNDTKGHHVGDLLLCEVAARVRTCVRGDDLVARLGGDEFVVLIESLSTDDRAARYRVREISEKILFAIDQPFQLDGDTFQTTASIGATLFQPGSHDLAEILKRADLAMYEAKAAGRGTVRFFREAMQAAAAEALVLTSDLRRALGKGDLVLHYQPVVDRAGRHVGAEALLRWRHPTRGLVSAADFIPLAERSGFMGTIDEWVLRTACGTLKAWEADTLTRNLQLAVNIGAGQLSRPDFATVVAAALTEAGADPSRLVLELTEHVMLDDVEQVSATMGRLKALGVRFALDDFGTGYSSLSYLKRLPFDTLKIDRSFVRDIETDPSDREIVQTILNIARSMKVAVIAEGVETEMQALLLRQMGCHAFQGYHFAPPEPIDLFLAGLRRQGGNRHPTALAVAS